MLTRCSNHEFNNLTKIHIFINGLQKQPNLFLDVIARGFLISKSAEDEIAIIERMAHNNHQGQHNKNPSQIKNGIMELNISDAIIA